VCRGKSASAVDAPAALPLDWAQRKRA